MPNLVGAEIHWTASRAAVFRAQVHGASGLLVLPRPVSLSVQLSLILLSLVRLHRAWFGRAAVALRRGAILLALFTQAVVLAVAIFASFRPLLLAGLAFGFFPCDLARFALLLGSAAYDPARFALLLGFSACDLAGFALLLSFSACDLGRDLAGMLLRLRALALAWFVCS